MSTAVAIVQHRFGLDEYERMVEAGIFTPEARVELIDGEILDMSPQSSRHATAVRLVEEALRDAFAIGQRPLGQLPLDVRVQLPLSLGDEGQPEPDVAVVDGSPRDYVNAHPTGARLVIEVSDTSLDFDRGRKRRLYARHGIDEYWILDLTSRRLEVFRSPRGEIYADTSLYAEGEEVSPAAASNPVQVSDLLP